MPDFGQVLMGLGGEGATIFQAVVDAVGVGVVTIRANGGTFTEVPYMEGGFYPFGPQIDDPVYVIAQKDWGLLCLGRPAPGPDRPSGSTGETIWDPFTMAKHTFSGSTWVVPGTEEVAVDTASAAVFFFSTGDLTGLDNTGLSTASFLLSVYWEGVEGSDSNYYVVGLHQNATPAGTLQKMTNLNAVFRRYAGASSAYISIPLDWASRLISGEAKGIYVQPDDYPATVSGPGTVRITEL